MSVSNQIITKQYAIYNGDCVQVMEGLPSNSVDLTLYSPPFRWFIPVFVRCTRHEQLH